MIETTCQKCAKPLQISAVTCGDCCFAQPQPGANEDEAASLRAELEQERSERDRLLADSDARIEGRAEYIEKLEDERDRLLPLARFAAAVLSDVPEAACLPGREAYLANRSGGIVEQHEVEGDPPGFLRERWAPGIRETIEELRRG